MPMNKIKRLSIIIPVYNEKRTILRMLKKVKSVNLKGIKKELILVDDYSKDGTRELLKKLKDPEIKVFYQDYNQGKGSAIRIGLKYVTGDVVIIQDADLEYEP